MSATQSEIDNLFTDDTPPEASRLGGGPRVSRRPGRPAPVHKVGPANGDVARILGLSIPVRVILVQRHMGLEAILKFTQGTIIEFDTAFDSELSLFAANRLIGHGHAVKMHENFGLRISAIDTVQERINAMGSR